MTKPAPHISPESVRVSEVLGALSFALDLTEGQPMGHSLRTCLIGMEIADRLGLPLQDRRDLYYASILKDVGCSSHSARVFQLFGGSTTTSGSPLALPNWRNYARAARFGLAYSAPGSSWFQRARRITTLAHAGRGVAGELVELRSQRGGEIVVRLGFGERVAEAVRALDEHWDGSGHPRGMRGGEIPLIARIISVAQVLEVFAMVDGPKGALSFARKRRGRWFDPTLVSACSGMDEHLTRWIALDEEGLRAQVREGEPGGAALLAGPGTLDRIAHGFAEIVDAKSSYTASHTFRVTDLAVKIADRIGHEDVDVAELERASLLHDIGKLSVPNSILDKPGSLTADEWEIVRMHPYYTQRILEHIQGFERLAFVAASHHERMDGRGYFRGLRGEQIPVGSRILATADIYDALSAPRPYRPALPQDVALRLMERDRDIGVWGESLDALTELLEHGETEERRAA